MKSVLEAIGVVLTGLLVVVLAVAFLAVLWAVTTALALGVPLFTLVLAYRAAGYVLPPGPEVPIWALSMLALPFLYVLVRGPRKRDQGSLVLLRGAVEGRKPKTPRPRVPGPFAGEPPTKGAA